MCTKKKKKEKKILLSVVSYWHLSVTDIAILTFLANSADPDQSAL